MANTEKRHGSMKSGGISQFLLPFCYIPVQRHLLTGYDYGGKW